MFTYGLEQFGELYMWERERDLRLTLRAQRRPAKPRRWLDSARQTAEQVVVVVHRLLGGSRQVPHRGSP